MDDCPCKSPGYCEEYKTAIVGRLWELCNDGTDLGRRYREQWRKRAAEVSGVPDRKGSGSPPHVVPPPPCRFEGSVVDFAPCSCETRHVRVCESDDATWSRCTRGPSLDPDVQSCQRCPLKVVTA